MVARIRYGCDPSQPALSLDPVVPGGVIRQVMPAGSRGVVVALQPLAGGAHQLVGMTQELAARQVVADGAEIRN